MSESSDPLRKFFRELRRRHVPRVAGSYVVAGVAVVGGADLLFPRLGLPDWSVQLVLGLTIVGLPVALVLAWAYDLTPEGVSRTLSEEASSSDTTPPPDPGTTDADARRIAVLPLSNIQADRDEDYFAEGMTEELISVLSRIHGLDVIARTSVMAYRDTAKSVAEIGHELAVGSILEGSVRTAGDKLRITVQLIDVGTQGHLWSRDYDREMEDVFEIQSDIAREVARALEVTLLGSERRRVERAPTDDMEAYNLYLIGRHHLNRRNDEGVRLAIDHFRRAVDQDPDFALAHAGLADAYILAAIGYAAIPEAKSLAGEAAERALELNPEQAEAHASLGYVALNDWDTQSAESSLRRALDLNPSDASSHQWYAQVALYRWDYHEAERRYARALELDPLSIVLRNEWGWPRLYLEDVDEAKARFRAVTAMDPSFAMAHFNLGNCYEIERRLDDAIECYRKAAALSQRMPMVLAFLAAALARAGRREEAVGLREEIIEASGEEAFLLRAMVDEGLGEMEGALANLQRALKAREPMMVALDTAWMPMPSLKEEPRYRRMVGRVREEMEGRMA